jgi:hypothetical protein
VLVIWQLATGYKVWTVIKYGDQIGAR